MTKVTCEWMLSKKRLILLKTDDGSFLSMVIEPKRLSPDGLYLRVGGYFSDQIKDMWLSVQDIVDGYASTLKEFEDAPPSKVPQSILQRLMNLLRDAHE